MASDSPSIRLRRRSSSYSPVATPFGGEPIAAEFDSDAEREAAAAQPVRRRGLPGDLGRPRPATGVIMEGHRYPVEIINHCGWLYSRFSLSFREVEELMPPERSSAQ